MRYVMRIFDTPLLEFEASYGEGLQAGERIVTSLDREGVKAGIKATVDDKGKAK